MKLRKNTFSITFGTGSNWANPFSGSSDATLTNLANITLQDAKARINGDGVNNADGGDYGVLFSNSARHRRWLRGGILSGRHRCYYSVYFATV